MQNVRTPVLNFKPRLEKIIEAILYIVHKSPSRDQYQIVKILYLADKEHFNRYGRPITFETYYALDYGPVASNALNLIKENTGKLKDDIFIEKRDNISILKSPKRGINYDFFSKSDIAVLDEIILEHGDKSFSELYTLTHSHFAYKSAWDNRGVENRSLMFYEDMLTEGNRKNEIMNNLSGISEYMR